MPNHLANENSPYLLQHADNPVDWYPWGQEALERAQTENKPIFLSIGYAACHWCHVMAHESFEDQTIADLLNTNFINIKVDREERLDLDNIYMNAVVAMTGQGGWPLSVFLTPDGQPFYGGTYFPPTRRYGRPSFTEALYAIIQIWGQDRERLFISAKELTEHIRSLRIPNSEFLEIHESQLDAAVTRLAEGYDWKFGGWGKAPKFPQPMTIEFLIDQAYQGDIQARDMAFHALDCMSSGGLYDIIGGGFARYSTDNYWLVPHFEKMLYDNAMLSRAYLHAYLLSGKVAYRKICEDTLGFILRELRITSQSGIGFLSSLDADSEGEEGKYYRWRLEELKLSLINLTEESINYWSFFQSAYDLPSNGNFEGDYLLRRKKDDSELAKEFSIPIDQVHSYLYEITHLLYDAREERTRPTTDDKVLTSWNALVMIAFAEAGRYLSRADYVDIAKKNATFILSELYDGRRLFRSWRAGKTQHPGYLEDYAGLILGLLSLYQSDPDPTWFMIAKTLTQEMIDIFSDEVGGFFDTQIDQDTLITRPKDLQDNATPCGNSLAANALLLLSSYTGAEKYRSIAEKTVQVVLSDAIRYPTAFAQWLIALEHLVRPVKEVAIVYKNDDDRLTKLIDSLWKTYRPDVIAAISDLPLDLRSPELLQNRPLLNESPTAYVCQDFVCSQPVNHPDQLENLL